MTEVSAALAMSMQFLVQAFNVLKEAGFSNPLSTLRQQLDSIASGGVDLPTGVVYERDGVTAPTLDYGLVRIQAVDDFREKLKEAGILDKVKHLIPSQYACQLGINKLSPRLADNSDWNPAYWIALTEVSWAPFWGGQFWEPDAWPVNKFKVTKGALLPFQAFERIPHDYVEDAIAMPAHLDTPQKILVELKRRVADYLDKQSWPRPDGVDFSPVPPRG